MERMTLDLSRTLARRGDLVSITCTDTAGYLAGVAHRDGIPLHVVPPGRGGRGLLRHLRELRPDVVHLHMAPWLKTALGARAAGAPLVTTLHGVPENVGPMGLRSMRLAARATRHVVLVADSLSEWALERLRVAEHKVCTILNGIDVEEYAPDGPARDLRGELGIAGEAMIVGTVARLAPVKNQQLLIRAVAESRLPGVHVVLVGEGECRA
ncbi:MAG: glycosyltransferase, partial [Gemmatimonadetes bacterium]|nr:glycosyltransferase [Gemmatimonadota bacterium]